MSEHPIEGLMTTAMQSIKEMVDVNTIVGDAVQAPDGTVIIPISKVSFGFAAGGGDYPSGKGSESSEDSDSSDEEKSSKFPFAGGSGAGVSINPVAFMVCGEKHIKLLPVNVNTSVDKILDLVPEMIQKLNDMMSSKGSKKKEEHGKKKEKDNSKEDDD